MGAIYTGPIKTTCKGFRPRKTFQQGRGWVWIESQVGTPDAVLNALAQYQALPNYVEFSITPQEDGVLDRLDAIWAEDATETTWEVKPIEAQADMLLYAYALGRLTDAQVEAIQIADKEDDSTDIAADARAMEYYRLIRRGEKYKTRNTVAVTLSQMNADRARLWVSTQYVDYVLLTTAQSILSGVTYNFGVFEGMPDDFWSGLPNDSISISQPTLVYGWLKGYPIITRAAWGKWMMQQQWTYGLWSTEVYDTYPVLAKPV